MAGGLPSIANTLTPEGILSMMQAAQAEQSQALAQRTQQASQAAGQAQQAYGQASQAPMPQLDPMNVMLQTLLPGIASVLTQDKGFTERGQQRLQQSKADLLKTRADNLQSLRDIYSQKADEAQKANDLEAAEKYRSKMALLDKQYDLVNKNLDRQAGLEEARIRADAAAKTAANERERRTLSPENVPIIAESVLSGQTKLTDYPIYEREQIVAYIRQNNKKILPPKARDTINTLKGARKIVDQVSKLSAQINTSKGGVGRFAQGAKAAGGAALQTNPNAALLQSTRKAFLATLARAAGERGTLTDQDIKRAEGLMPGMADTKEVADRKLSQLRTFINELEQGAISAYTEEQPSQTIQQAGVQKWGRDAQGNPIPLGGQ